MTKINLDINNFGPLKTARIGLKKINIIAGINGSGKTILSKLLYSFLLSNSKERNYLANQNIDKQINSIIIELKNKFSSDLKNLEKLTMLKNNLPDITDEKYNVKIKNCIASLKEIIDKTKPLNKHYKNQIELIENVLKDNETKTKKYFNLSNNLLNSEFDFHDIKLHSNTTIKFHGKDNDCKFSHEIKTNENEICFKIDERSFNCLDIKNVAYIDSTSIFENGHHNHPYHLLSLLKLLKLSENNNDIYDIEFNQKIDEIRKKLDEIMEGYIYYDEKTNQFIFKKENNDYSMKNTASGIKQIGIIQMLLSNRVLNKNSFLIIDEIEVNIHPEWQVKLAKILVLLAKDLNVNLFINSHSPIFIEAIEVYSIKYRLRNDTNFFLTKKDENTEKFNVKKIEYKNLYKLYNDLGNPYDKINEVRGQNLARQL